MTPLATNSGNREVLFGNRGEIRGLSHEPAKRWGVKCFASHECFIGGGTSPDGPALAGPISGTAPRMHRFMLECN